MGRRAVRRADGQARRHRQRQEVFRMPEQVRRIRQSFERQSR